MALVLMCSASDTRHSPKTCAKRWSRSSRASTSNKTSPRHFLAVLSTRLSQRKERATRISAPISSATTSAAIFTSRSRIHLFRIPSSVKSRRRVNQRLGKISLQRQPSGLPFPLEAAWVVINRRHDRRACRSPLLYFLYLIYLLYFQILTAMAGEPPSLPPNLSPPPVSAPPLSLSF